MTKNSLYIAFLLLLLYSCQPNSESPNNKETVTYDDDSIRCPEGKHTD